MVQYARVCTTRALVNHNVRNDRGEKQVLCEPAYALPPMPIRMLLHLHHVQHEREKRIHRFLCAACGAG